ncbi:MAG: hypothetical protein N3B21_15045 [Clostridia bacterium]|nr:hypothetical protein [Clostridia bacterium]
MFNPMRDSKLVVIFKLIPLKRTFISMFSAAAILILYFSNVTAALSPERETEVIERIDEILSSQEFSSSVEQKSLLKLAAEKLWELAKNFFRKVNFGQKVESLFGQEISPVAALTLKIAGIAIIAVFIVLLLYFVFRNMRTSKKVKQLEDAVLLSMLKDFEAVERKAVEYANNNDFRQGIRYLYMASLLRFNEKNIIKIDKAKTNRQYLKEISNSGYPMYNQVSDFTNAFNEYWYGNRNIDRDKFNWWYQKYIYLKTEGRI